MTLLYVSGPMTGIPEFNYPAFEDGTVRLRAAGYDVVSPHEVNPADGIEHPWEWYMRRDIAALTEADGVACLPGWAKSRGASLESYIAGELGIRVLPIEAWLSVSGSPHGAHAYNVEPLEEEE